MTWGQETITFFEIDQPFCNHDYGVAPCAAALAVTGAFKCYNNRFTCQDVANYDPGTLTLRFGFTSGGSDIGTLYGNVIPLVESITVTPASVNIGGTDPNVEPLGNRETVSVKMVDAQHSDLQVDKYRLERIDGTASDPSVPFDPFYQGTFIGKWLARNKFYASYPAYRARIRRGYVGQDLNDMQVNLYAIDRIDVAPDGKATFNLKDIFGQLVNDKAVFPKASLGELSADINSSTTSATLAPAGIGNANYPASGYIRIGHECMSFTRSGDALTIARAALNTEADDHKTQDAVQLVGVLGPDLAHDIVYELLTDGYTPFTTGDVDKTQWDTDTTTAAMTNLYTAYVTKPTPVAQLISELSEQAGFSLFPNTQTGMIMFKPLVAGVPPFAVTDNAWLVGDNMSFRKQDTKRISQVWVYYGQVDPTQDLKNVNNYRSRYVTIDSEAESPQQYGNSIIREVFSRFIPALGRASATDTGDRLLFMFRDSPLEAKFEVHKSRLPSFSPAGLFTLRTKAVQDVLGLPEDQTHAVIKIKQSENRAEISSQQIFLAAPNFTRRIFADNDILTPINIRTEHDKLYTPPSGAETVQFIIAPDVVLGSNTISNWALDTGDWPVGTVLEIYIGTGAEIWGMAGVGGEGGHSGFNSGPPPGPRPANPYLTFFAENGFVGGNGGPALRARRAVTVDNLGTINGGSAGGGGGGAAYDSDGFSFVGGSGGGAGRGPVSAVGGPPGLVWYIGFAGASQGPTWNWGNTGGSGSYSAAGAGGAAITADATDGITKATGGAGGNGGTPPSLTGSTGGNGSHVSSNGVDGTGASAGTPGHAVDGNSNITWTHTGTRNGTIA